MRKNRGCIRIRFFRRLAIVLPPSYSAVASRPAGLLYANLHQNANSSGTQRFPCTPDALFLFLQR
jgi:hypothetical protein